MVTYTVHERDSDVKDITARAEAILFVKEGFAWLALLFPVLWMLFHRMWLVLLFFIVIVAALQVGFAAAGAGEAAAGWVTFALSLLFALQANDLRRWSLARKGYQLAGLVSGRDLRECEQRFFDDWLAVEDTPAGGTPKTSPPVAPSGKAAAAPAESGGQGDEVIGLFPETDK